MFDEDKDDERLGKKQHPRKVEGDPHGQKEYRERTREALDPHRKDEVKPI